MSQHNANIWIVIADDVFQQIKDKIGDPEYDGLLINLVRFIRRQADYIATRKLWKQPTIAGKVRHLFSVSYSKDDDLQVIRDAIDTLSVELGTDFGVAGAWWWDSRQIGTQWNEDQTDTTGTPLYPINETQLLKFMPDRITYDENGDVVSVDPATELTDVNLEQGQAPRKFI